jgi:ubiquinone/menaquinone biosynthesis C-methylase UbiE
VEVRSLDVPGHDPEELRGDRQTQHEVLEALSECANHRRWFAAFATPYLGSHPIEIGSGFGDYALEWIPAVDKYTATEADPALFTQLREHMSAYPSVSVKQLMLPSPEQANHSCLIAYNVLEHIDDHVSALRSMAQLVQPGGYVVLVCPAFPFAMSPVDIATGHVRRYTRRSMRAALVAAGLQPQTVRYANSLGLICYYTFTSLLRKAPSPGATMTVYDRLVVPLVRQLERAVRPPFGQSVLAVARVPQDGGPVSG